MSKSGPDIAITLEDVALIMGPDFEKEFQRIIETVYCPHCRKPYTATMSVEKVWLTALGDILLEGKCRNCGGRVNRYIETGESPESYEQAMAIRSLKMDLLNDYEIRQRPD